LLICLIIWIIIILYNTNIIIKTFCVPLKIHFHFQVDYSGMSMYWFYYTSPYTSKVSLNFHSCCNENHCHCGPVVHRSLRVPKVGGSITSRVRSKIEQLTPVAPLVSVHHLSDQKKFFYKQFTVCQILETINYLFWL